MRLRLIFHGRFAVFPRWFMGAACLMTTLLFSVPAGLAEDSYPDIVGTWVGEGADIRMNSDGSGVIFSSETITQIVTEQRDRRFTGEMHSGSGASEKFSVEFVGVFVDGSHFRWSEPNGFVEGRVIDADTIDSCYVRTAPEGQNAACQTLKRVK